MTNIEALEALGNLRMLLTDTPNPLRHKTRISEMDEMLSKTAEVVGEGELLKNFYDRIRWISADVRDHKIDCAYDGVLRLYAAVDFAAHPERYARSVRYAA